MSAVPSVAGQQQVEHDSDLDERALLGTVMEPADERCVSDARELLDHVGADVFRLPAHAAIWQAITSLDDDGDPVTPQSVASRLRDAGQMRGQLSDELVFELWHQAPPATTIPYNVGRILDAHSKRGAREAFSRGQQMLDGQWSVPEVAAQIADALDDVTSGPRRDTCASVTTAADGDLAHLDALHAGELPDGLPVPYADLQRLIGGLHAGQMVVVAARPSIGKSTVAADLARDAVLRQQAATVVFSLEMSAFELRLRMACAESGVPHENASRQGSLSAAQRDRIAAVYRAFSDAEANAAPLFIDEGTDTTTARMRAVLRRLIRRHPVQLVVIDYLQLLTSVGGRYESRQQEVSEMSRQLKLLAKEMQVPIVVLAQLNRGPEQRTDKRPQVSDLRESGALEQDADQVWLLHRPDMHDPDDRPSEVDLIVGKNRNGSTGTVTLAQQLHKCRFVDFAADVPPEPPKPSLHAV